MNYKFLISNFLNLSEMVKKRNVKIIVGYFDFFFMFNFFYKTLNFTNSQKPVFYSTNCFSCKN